MITSLVEQWDKNKHNLESYLEQNHPKSYNELVCILVEYVLTEPLRSGQSIDPNRIHMIDDGSYQGTEIYLLGLYCYQPTEIDYLWFSNSYGSCSGCDTLMAIRSYEYEDVPPTTKQVSEYMTLALHIVQRIKWLDE